jgi:hypothetical protein
VRCDEVAPILSAMSDGTVVPSRQARAHVEVCLRCQAELVQYRRVLRVLHSLRSEVLEPAPGLLSDVLAAVEEAGERHAVRSLVRRHRLAYVGGLAAATAAGAAGAIVLATRTRRHRPALAG